MHIIRTIAQAVSVLFDSVPDSRTHFSRKRDEYGEEPERMGADEMDGFELHNAGNGR